MPYVVVNREGSVLSRASGDALLSWVDIGVSRATDFRYAITFETLAGAHKCAGMQGGTALPTSIVGWMWDSAGRVGAGGDAGVACLGG